MNLKITNIQISSYAENEELPNLQYLADKLCEDDDMEYVLAKSKANASLDKIDVTNLSSIYTKLKEYPYEFEINSSLQLASIDGVKVANNSNEDTVTLTKNQYDSILNRLSALENNSTTSSTNNNYSTEEQVVGTWVDNRPIYRKNITITVNNTTGYTFNAKEILSEDIDIILKTYGYSIVDSGTVVANFPCYYNSNAYLSSWYSITNSIVNIISGTQYATAVHYLSFEYTKTSDIALNN